MIKIYTKKAQCPKPLIITNDKYFDTNLSHEYLDDQCRRLMFRIDGAEILDENTWAVKTKFGIAEITHLSTGLKTLINIYNLRKKDEVVTVDVREIGENLVPDLLKLVDGTKICLYSGRNNFIGIISIKDYKFLINDVHKVVGTEGLGIKLEELRREKC